MVWLGGGEFEALGAAQQQILLAGEAVARDREVGEALGEGGEQFVGLDQGERLAEAEVRANAEGEDVTGVGLAGDVETVGIIEQLGISMRRSDVDEDGIARLKAPTADPMLLDHEAEQDVGGAVPAEGLDDSTSDEIRLIAEELPLLWVLEQREDGVAEHHRGRPAAGLVEEREEGDRLLQAEPLFVLLGCD